ncbi:MAG: porin [Burkholderiaceae bacterium]|jgi:predicted porin|nr:porin [Burkholderiaceae bacterium]
MKKILIAAAALSVVSCAALAQSSVTLYGVADVGIGKAKSTGDQKWGTEANSVVNNSFSVIGLHGAEDLGGGMYAGFRYEGQVNLATGDADGGVQWNRSAYVYLKSDSFGTVMLGRNWSPSFMGQYAYELTGMANYSVLWRTFGFGSNGDPWNNAQIAYMTPTLYGVSAEIAYIPKADGGLLDDGVANQTDRWSANVIYDQGPIKAAITADKSSKTAVGGTANKMNWSAGGAYKFGDSFALSASYNHSITGGGVFVIRSAAMGNRRYGWELGGSAFMGPFTVTVDLTRDTKNEFSGGKKYTNGMFEGKYSLSKRTFLYIDYLRLDGDNNYGLGIRHNF